MKEIKYRVLLYYKFVNIDEPIEYAKEHLEFCNSLGLKGRILVAKEGLNGTVSGTFEQTDAYMEAMHSDPKFKDMVFKIDDVQEHAFKKMYVRHRDSIITLLPEEDVNPMDKVGTYLKPKEWLEMLKEEDVIIVDGRNDYEYEIGHFRGAVKPNVKNFKQFPGWIEDNLSMYKDKKILTYCTGGIRCEKLTGVLLNKGFKNVYHLEGGIVTYSKDSETKGELFDGKCYVFDNRISVKINYTEDDVVISSCRHCGKPCDRYINCTNDNCHDQHICCENCEKTFEGFCSEKCRQYGKANPERDARRRLKAKAETYRKYNQIHQKAIETNTHLANIDC